MKLTSWRKYKPGIFSLLSSGIKKLLSLIFRIGSPPSNSDVDAETTFCGNRPCPPPPPSDLDEKYEITFCGNRPCPPPPPSNLDVDSETSFVV